MDTPPPPAPGPVAPVPPALQTAWPRSAQLTTAFLLGVAATLLAVHFLGQLRRGSRPTELTYRVDLNHAQRAELLQLPGVGNSLAERIEAYRDEHGGFGSVDELTQVHGIGPATLERLRPCVYIRPEDAREAPGEVVRLTRKERQAPAKGGAKKGADLARTVDLNQASEAELQKVPGLGPVLAKRVVEERRKRPFRSVEELTRVPGIKQKKLDQLRPYVTVGDEPVRVASERGA